MNKRIKLPILIVEDDPEQAMALRFAIQKNDRYEVIWSDTAEDAIARWNNGQAPVFVITDVNLEEPRLGFEVATFYSQKGVPVIVVTGRDTVNNDKSSSALHGAVRFFQKPYDVGELISTMTNMLKVMNKIEHVVEIVPGVEFDLVHGILSVYGKAENIGDIAAQILNAVFQSNGQIMAVELSRTIYGEADIHSMASLHSAIKRLNQKFNNLEIPIKFKNQRGRGEGAYRAVVEESVDEQ